MTSSTRPRIVALGGGHGLATTLRAASTLGEVTAIVSTADDGGSSGRIRGVSGGFAVGDIRRCLEALADESVLASQLGHRIGEAGELEGHPIGNLLLAGLIEATGDLEMSIAEVARLVHARGRILPAASDPVVLEGRVGDTWVRGQVATASTPGVASVRMVPDDARSPAAAVDALAEADLIVLGPGSIFTSVLAAILPQDIARALRDAAAPIVFVANLFGERTEAAGYTLCDFINSVLVHGVTPDTVLADVSQEGSAASTVPTVYRPVARSDGRAHDPFLLATALRDLA